MRTPTLIATALVVAGTVAGAQAPGFKRTVVQQGDLSTPGREVVQALVEFQPGGSPGRHTHPGEEVGYVIEGTFSLEQDGQAGGDAQGWTGLHHPRGPGAQRDQHRPPARSSRPTSWKRANRSRLQRPQVIANRVASLVGRVGQVGWSG